MENRLEYLDDFRKVLQGYEVSESGKKILASTKLAILVGPTSAGKNTIVNKLLKTGHYHWVVSDTTRAPRENDGVMEQNGVEYWFRSEEDMLKDLRAGKYIEAAVIHGQQVSGTSIRELETAEDQGLVALHEIEVEGVHNVMTLKPDAQPFFIVPPSFEEWMRRLHKRGSLDEKEKRRRLETTMNEFKVALERDYFTFVVNDDIEDALEQIKIHTLTGKSDPEHDARGRATAADLLNKITEKLKSE